MKHADLLEFDRAAEAFGVSREVLLRRLDGGGLPEAVKYDGSWTVPGDALAAIAEREGWSLDLTVDPRSGRSGAVPDHLNRFVSDSMAANAAVVMARTQATAARAEARDLSRRLRQLTDELDLERVERERIAAELTKAAKAQAILERDHAVAEARADELRRQLDQERVERSLLSTRIGVVEADREHAVTAMGWWSRRRYRLRRAAAGCPPPG